MDIGCLISNLVGGHTAKVGFSNVVAVLLLNYILGVFADRIADFAKSLAESSQGCASRVPRRAGKLLCLLQH